MSAWAVAALAIALILAPALPGVATRTRAWLTGRRGQPILQLYFELAKLLRKRAVYGAGATWLFRAAPALGTAATLLAALFVPFDGRAAPASFAGDFVLVAGLLSLGRFLLVLAALDTGSSFEGMGASREAMIGAFAEAGIFLVFAALSLATGHDTVAGMLGAPLGAAWSRTLPSLAMVAVALFVLLLAETGRVPVDDPATHLELTMIHEVAILDHSALDLGLLLYGSALRFALMAMFVAGVLAPRAALPPALSLVLLPLSLVAVAIVVGVVEGVMARLRLTRVPQLLVAASSLVAFAMILLLGRG